MNRDRQMTCGSVLYHVYFYKCICHQQVSSTVHALCVGSSIACLCLQRGVQVDHICRGHCRELTEHDVAFPVGRKAPVRLVGLEGTDHVLPDGHSACMGPGVIS